MAVQALTTINELLYRPLCSPDATDTLLLEIFQNGIGLFQLMERLDSIEEKYGEFFLLRKIYCDILIQYNMCQHKKQDKIYSFSYTEKMTEFLQLFVTNHLKRMESSSKFPVNTLLEVLCHHTFQQVSTVNGYLRCLDVWTTLLESTQSRYSAVALALAERILQKISFKLNARVLRELDTESLDENVGINLYITCINII